MTDDALPPQRPRGKRRGGIKHTDALGRTANNSLIDPKTGDYREAGNTVLAKRAKLERDKATAEAEWLAHHLQLDSRGRVPERWAWDGSMDRSNRGPQARKKNYDALTNYPRIPDGELERLEGIIQKYGLPLAALSSDVAAFVVRRVMVDFYRLASLRRQTRKGLFTQDEFIALLKHLEMNPKQFAEYLGTANPNAARNSIYRWFHGISAPTGILAIKVNRLIEQQIRRKGVRTGGNAERFRGTHTSDNPITAERRARKERERRREAEMHIPLARSAQEREADATERPDGGS